MFVITIIFAIATIVILGAIIFGKLDGLVLKIIAGVTALVTIATLLMSVMYTQDVGQSFVLKDWTGTIVGERTASGLGIKAPWTSLAEFDTRNQLVAYIGDGSTNYNGQPANGPQITTTDSSGTTVNIDVAVVYSIQPDSVQSIYTAYQNQENFRARLVEQDVRSVVRDAPGSFTTVQLLTQRDKVASQIKDTLTARWAKEGVIVENVALQDIRYSAQVQAGFDAAQQARTQITKSTAELQAAQIDAQQKVVQAQADAKANDLVNSSLTGPILQQRYLDTLKTLAAAGNLVITDGTGSNIINIPAKK